MRARDRPWKLLALVAFGTAGLIYFGVDLADGDVTLRRHGPISATANPVRFALTLLSYQFAWAVIGIGWFSVREEWTMDYRPPAKPKLEDRERSRPY